MTELSEQQKNSNATQKTHRSRSGFWFGVIILIVIASLAGVGFYLFYELREKQQGLGGEVNKRDIQLIELSKQITGYQSQLAALTADIAAKDNHFNKTLADFSQLHNEKLAATHKELTDTVQQLQRQLGRTRGDWLVADAEYLLVIANERLHLMSDVNTTREALEAADERLRESGDAGTIAVREQIIKELAVLKSISILDTVKIYAEIQTLQDQVDALVLSLPYTGKTLTPASENTKHKAKSNDDNGLLSGLEGIVTIRRTAQPIKEILTPEEAQFIHEQLRVKLEMAKIALVQHNEALFQASLTDAKKWTEQHFAQNEAVGNLLAELNRLSAIKIRSQFPDIGQSLKMLRDITKLRIEADKAALPTNETGTALDSTPSAPVAQPAVPAEQ